MHRHLPTGVYNKGSVRGKGRRRDIKAKEPALLLPYCLYASPSPVSSSELRIREFPTYYPIHIPKTSSLHLGVSLLGESLGVLKLWVPSWEEVSLWLDAGCRRAQLFPLFSLKSKKTCRYNLSLCSVFPLFFSPFPHPTSTPFWVLACIFTPWTKKRILRQF